MEDFPAQTFEIQPVALWTRFLAWSFDCFLFGLAMIPVVLAMTLPFAQEVPSVEGISSEALDLAVAMAQSLIGFLIQFPIYTYFYYISGQTPGKRLFKIRIVDSLTLEPLSGIQAAGRYLGTILSSCCCYAGYFLAFFNRDRRALHDFIAGTRVAYSEPVPWTTGEVILTLGLCLMAGAGILLLPFAVLAWLQELTQALEAPLFPL